MLTLLSHNEESWQAELCTINDRKVFYIYAVHKIKAAVPFAITFQVDAEQKSNATEILKIINNKRDTYSKSGNVNTHSRRASDWERYQRMMKNSYLPKWCDPATNERLIHIVDHE